MQLFPVCRTKNRDRRRITEYMLRRDTERQKAQTRKRVVEKCKSYPCVRAFPPRGPSENARWSPPGIHQRTLRWTPVIQLQWRMNATGIHKRTLCGRQLPHSPALCSRYFGFVRPVPFLQSHIVTWFRAIPFPCASLGIWGRILSHGFLWRVHSPAYRSGRGYGVLWQFHSPASR